MDVVFLYGSPAVGKFSVAEELTKLTGYLNFHNHLTVDLVNALFDWGTIDYARLVRRYRFELLELAARRRVPGVIYTYVYCAKHDKRDVRGLLTMFKRRKVRVLFVQLLASRHELLKRVRHEFAVGIPRSPRKHY